MGICIDLVNCEFKMLKKNKKKAFKVLKELPAGTWVDQSEINEAKTIEDLLIAWRYEPCNNENGDIIELEFTGEKEGSCEEMFEVISPYVEPGSILVFDIECMNDHKYIEFGIDDGILEYWM